MKIISIIIYLICSVGGLVLIKSEANSVNVALQSGVFNLSMGIKSILGITQILVILAGVFLFKESMNIYGIIGIFLIIAGITLLNIK